MKRNYLLFASALCLFASCQKADLQPVTTDNTNTTPKGYIQVTCDNCRVDYGMPDQYKGFDLKGTSPKATFTYTPGYVLQTYITPLDHTQKLIYAVHNSADKVIYADTVTQAVNTIWQTNVMLHDN